MSLLPDNAGIFVPFDEAEVLDFPNINITRLLAEGASTNGAFSALRTHLLPGADGARPHHHGKASELFFVLDGAIDILAGDAVITATKGDFAVVNPGAMHAFANGSKTAPADMLIVFGPAVERFGYFRLLQQVVGGKATLADILATQEQYDNWFGDSPAWMAHRSG